MSVTVLDFVLKSGFLSCLEHILGPSLLKMVNCELNQFCTLRDKELLEKQLNGSPAPGHASAMGSYMWPKQSDPEQLRKHQPSVQECILSVDRPVSYSESV